MLTQEHPDMEWKAFAHFNPLPVREGILSPGHMCRMYISRRGEAGGSLVHTRPVVATRLFCMCSWHAVQVFESGWINPPLPLPIREGKNKVSPPLFDRVGKGLVSLLLPHREGEKPVPSPLPLREGKNAATPIPLSQEG